MSSLQRFNRSEEQLIMEKPVTARSIYRNELFASISTWTLTLLSHYISGITSSTIFDLTNEGYINDDQANWFASLLFLSATIGCVISSFIADYLGRKLSLMISAVIGAVGWLMILLVDAHLSLLFIGRFLCGLHFGIRCVIVGIYQVEVTSEPLRGPVSLISGVMFTGGIMMAFALRSFLTWRWLAVVGLLMTLISIVSMYPIPESPRWYIKHGRYQEAKESLLWLRMGNVSTVESELAEMRSSCDQNKAEVSFNDFFRKRRIWQPSLLALLMIVSTTCSGDYAIYSFVWQIMQNVGIKNEKVVTLVLSISQMLLCIVVAILSNYFGRRQFLIIGFIIVACALYFLSLADFLKRHEWGDDLGWLFLASFILYYIGVGIGVISVPVLVVAEILPLNIRGTVSGVAIAMLQFLVFISTHAFMILFKSINPYGAFLIYGILSTACVILISYALPETKGKTLEEIEAYFKD